VKIKETDENCGERWDNMISNEIVETNQAMFLELHSISTKIKNTFIPMGRPARLPKTFTKI